MRFLTLTLLSLATSVLARPESCESTATEKLHEGHGHNINTGDVAGAHLGLKLPGGSGCWKGQKVQKVTA
jgi:hypothetical protein